MAEGSLAILQVIGLFAIQVFRRTKTRWPHPSPSRSSGGLKPAGHTVVSSHRHHSTSRTTDKSTMEKSVSEKSAPDKFASEKSAFATTAPLYQLDPPI